MTDSVAGVALFRALNLTIFELKLFAKLGILFSPF